LHRLELGIDADKQTDFLNQIAAKSLLVCVNSDAEASKRVCYIGTDNVTAGKQAADLIRAALPQGGINSGEKKYSNNKRKFGTD